MDMIESLAKQASQITMYDVKSYYNQAKNMVLNLSETEAKVREATNDDPWGASSTLMQEIADGTHNFSQFNEIMPTIYARFMEKEAREWRQIYKALTLLEFLVKNGSERVVDDARAHISTIKMLRSFHYIDEKGKDQGINVRNRSSEIALLLSDVEKIRQERRKAKANKQKYSGTGNDGGMSFRTATGSRYGGFGSETLGGGGGGEGGSSRYTGGGGGYEQDDYRPSRTSSRAAAPEYDEYEGADDFDEEPRQPRRSSSNRKPNPPPKNEPKPKAKEVEKPKEVNLFDFDDEPISAPAAAPVAPAAAAPVAGFGGDDDFDDFQSGPSSAVPSFNATPATTSPAPPKPASNSNLFDLLNSSTPSVPAPAPQQQYQPSPSYTQVQQPPRYGQAPVAQPTSASRPNYYSSSSTTSAPSVTSPAASKPASASTFDDLWASSLSSIGKPNPNAGQNGPKKSINDLEKEKAMNGLWGAAPASGQSSFGGQNASKSNNDDLLF